MSLFLYLNAQISNLEKLISNQQFLLTPKTVKKP